MAMQNTKCIVLERKVLAKHLYLSLSRKADFHGISFTLGKTLPVGVKQKVFFSIWHCGRRVMVNGANTDI